jgi:hypothetical protein
MTQAISDINIVHSDISYNMPYLGANGPYYARPARQEPLTGISVREAMSWTRAL